MGEPYTTTTTRAYNEYKLAKTNGDAEVTAPAYVRNDDKLYLPTTFCSKRGRDLVLSQDTGTSSPAMQNSFQLHLSHEGSLGIKRVNCDVLKLLLHKEHFAFAWSEGLCCTKQSWCSSIEAMYPRQNVTEKSYFLFTNSGILTLVTYHRHFTLKIHLHGVSVDDATLLKLCFQPFVAFSLLPSWYMHVCIPWQASPTYHHRWLQCSNLVIKIPPWVSSRVGNVSHFSVKTEVPRNVLIEVHYERLPSIDDELHYRPHLWCSLSDFYHSNWNDQMSRNYPNIFVARAYPNEWKAWWG